MIIATAGHVDHGKTLLVKALTGIDTDRLPEEKKRGLTIELGFAYRDLGDGETTGFIDVPGHERFIRTMVAGVSGIDVVLFVIAADDGPMPQTAEHLAILDLLDVRHGVVALSKIDRVDSERVDKVSAAMREMMETTGLAESRIVPVSAMKGTGVDALRAAILDLKKDLPERSQDGNFRLAIDRSFLLKGTGRVVTGTVFSGELKVGGSVHHVPGGGELRVRAIHAQNSDADAAVNGQRCALNITGAGLREAEIHRGDWIVAAGAAFATKRFDASIRVLESEARALRNRTPVHVHVGATDTIGRLVTLDGNAIQPGGEGRVQIMLEREIHAVRGDSVVLRDQSALRTMGGGRILDPLPIVRGRTRAVRTAYLDAMALEDAGAAARRSLECLPEGIELELFARSWNLTAGQASELFDVLPMVSIKSSVGAVGIPAEQWQSLKSGLLDALQAMHDEAPDHKGATEAALARALPVRPSADLLNAVLAELIEDRAIVREAGAFRLPGYTPTRSPQDEALWQRIHPLLNPSDLKVPVVHDMLDSLGMKFEDLRDFLDRSAQQAYLVKVNAKRYFLPATMKRLVAFVGELVKANPDGVFSVADYRNLSGIGRNAVVDILEYFDRIGYTRRHGQVRKVLDPSRVDGG
ncbi:MAG: selenocysteine-specific translation elongation factor [Pseudomonadota bacterium]|nr:selenocysteine-specific translation elongation factor [Pseudomonadota bacterium]